MRAPSYRPWLLLRFHTSLGGEYRTQTATLCTGTNHRIGRGAKRAQANYGRGRTHGRPFGNRCFVGNLFVPVRSIHRRRSRFIARVSRVILNFLPMNHKPQLCLGAGNARNLFAGVFCVMNHKPPARPGAGNARQNFGERLLCKIESQTQCKSSENAREIFAGTFLRLE